VNFGSDRLKRVPRRDENSNCMDAEALKLCSLDSLCEIDYIEEGGFLQGCKCRYLL
jgi:hypothetical protein